MYKFERPHRVRLFTKQIHLNDAIKSSNREMYMQAAEEFSKTNKYRWVEHNHINLNFDFDDNSVDWFKQVRFYADLDEAQYVDYCLRFFDHYDEEWK